MTITPLAVLATYELFNYQTAISTGLTSADLKRALREGTITRLKKGWYTCKVLQYPIERHRLLTKIEVADHSGSVASHYSALSLLEIPVIDVPLSVVNIMLDRPRYGRHRRSLKIHNPYPDAGAKTPGLLSVSPALGIVQTATVSPTAGLAAGDHAVRHGLTTAAEILTCLDALGGRNHCATAAVALSLIDPRRESPGESKMTYVAHLMGYELEPQFRIMTKNGERFADARIRGTRVLLEYDGREKYGESSSGTVSRELTDPLFREKLREDDIRDEEWEVVRVTKESFDYLSQLGKRIERAVARAEQHSVRPGMNTPPSFRQLQSFRSRSKPALDRYPTPKAEGWGFRSRSKPAADRYPTPKPEGSGAFSPAARASSAARGPGVR